MQITPVPRDIPLPLPVEAAWLEALLVIAFIAHLIFVNLMVGASLLVLGFEIRGLKNPAYDRVARRSPSIKASRLCWAWLRCSS